MSGLAMPGEWVMFLLIFKMLKVFHFQGDGIGAKQ